MTPDRYNFQNLKESIVQPHKFLNEASRLANKSKFVANQGWPCDFMAEDWDNLIILDACRYDIFEEVNTLDGELDYRISEGSTSWAFMEQNFVDRELHDTVYVTGNAHTPKLDDDIFHAIEHVLVEPLSSSGYHDFPENSYAMLPEDILEAALDAYERFPEKRLIVHFMQPHTPYLGETGCKMYNQVNNRKDDITVDIGGYAGNIKLTVYQLMNNGAIEFNDATLRNAYVENLELVLNHVEELLEKIDGRTVITADHGECLGEKPLYHERTRYNGKLYGHIPEVRPELRKVPWLVQDSETRRKVVSEDPIGRDEVDEDQVQQQLKALGYA